jgi:hypothetical protein
MGAETGDPPGTDDRRGGAEPPGRPDRRGGAEPLGRPDRPGTDRPGWRRLVGVPLVVALEVPLVLVLGSANDLSGAQTGLALLLIAGGTAAASGSAVLLRREEEQAAKALAEERLRGERATGGR